jgi:hypothetical protein
VARDPLRPLRRADRLRRGEAIPARARLEQLLEWVAPVAEEIGAAPFLACPSERRRAADRPARRGRDAGRDLRRAGAARGASRPWLTSGDDPRERRAAGRGRGLDVEQLLISSRLDARLARLRKLERGDLAQAKLAIDAVAALLPLLEGDLQRDLEPGALTGLQVAFVDAAA